MSYGFTTLSQELNSNPLSGSILYCHKRRSSEQLPQQDNWRHLSSGILRRWLWLKFMVIGTNLISRCTLLPCEDPRGAYTNSDWSRKCNMSFFCSIVQGYTPPCGQEKSSKNRVGICCPIHITEIWPCRTCIWLVSEECHLWAEVEAWWWWHHSEYVAQIPWDCYQKEIQAVVSIETIEKDCACIKK